MSPDERSSNSDELFSKWHFRVDRMMRAHYDSAAHFERLNLWIGVPIIALSTIVGTTIFINLQKSPSIAVQVLTGLLSVAAGALSGLQTFVRHAERAEKHRVAGSKFAGLKTEIESISCFQPEEAEKLKEAADAFRVRWSTMNDESPTIPPRIWTVICDNGL